MPRLLMMVEVDNSDPAHDDPETIADDALDDRFMSQFGRPVSLVSAAWVEDRPASGVELIADERHRQVEAEGYDAAHDADHDEGELESAAIAYLLAADPDAAAEFWPWDAAGYKPSTDSISNLVKAGALVAAEIDRLVAAG